MANGYTPWGSTPKRDAVQDNIIRDHGKEQFDFVILIVSILAGIASGWLSLWIYMRFYGSWFKPLLIGTVCLVFFAVFSLIMILVTLIRGLFPISHNMVKRTVIPFLLFSIGIFAAGTLFEFLYELGPSAKESSCIFLVDNSASMDWTDENRVRFDAINQIVGQMDPDFPYAIYTFDSDTRCVREMSSSKNGGLYSAASSTAGGGTKLKKALEALESDFASGKILNAGKKCKLVIITDGVPSDVPYFGILDDVLGKLKDRGVTISTIGLGNAGDDLDEVLLNKLADAGDGKYVFVEKVNDLELGLQQAVRTDKSRDLLSYRFAADFEWLFMLERMLFMGVIGFAMGIAVLLMLSVDRFDLTNRSEMIKGALSGIVLELLYKFVPISGWTICMIFFVMNALILGKLMKKTRSTSSMQNGFGAGQGMQPQPRPGMPQRPNSPGSFQQPMGGGNGYSAPNRPGSGAPMGRPMGGPMGGSGAGSSSSGSGYNQPRYGGPGAPRR